MEAIVSTSIPEYAHPVPVSADGIPFKRVHGPRTEMSAKRRAGYAQLYMDIMADRAAQSFEARMAEANR